MRSGFGLLLVGVLTLGLTTACGENRAKSKPPGAGADAGAQKGGGATDPSAQDQKKKDDSAPAAPGTPTTPGTGTPAAPTTPGTATPAAPATPSAGTPAAPTTPSTGTPAAPTTPSTGTPAAPGTTPAAPAAPATGGDRAKVEFKEGFNDTLVVKVNGDIAAAIAESAKKVIQAGKIVDLAEVDQEKSPNAFCRFQSNKADLKLEKGATVELLFEGSDADDGGYGPDEGWFTGFIEKGQAFRLLCLKPGSKEKPNSALKLAELDAILGDLVKIEIVPAPAKPAAAAPAAKPAATAPAAKPAATAAPAGPAAKPAAPAAPAAKPAAPAPAAKKPAAPAPAAKKPAAPAKK